MSYPPLRYHGSQDEISAGVRRADHPAGLPMRVSSASYLATGRETSGLFGLYRWDFTGPPTTSRHLAFAPRCCRHRWTARRSRQPGKGSRTWPHACAKQVAPATDNGISSQPDGCTIRTDSHGNVYVFGVGSRRGVSFEMM